LFRVAEQVYPWQLDTSNEFSVERPLSRLGHTGLQRFLNNEVYASSLQHQLIASSSRGYLRERRPSCECVWAECGGANNSFLSYVRGSNLRRETGIGCHG
jgi:hypothetical protein